MPYCNKSFHLQTKKNQTEYRVAFSCFSFPCNLLVGVGICKCLAEECCFWESVLVVVTGPSAHINAIEINCSLFFSPGLKYKRLELWH